MKRACIGACDPPGSDSLAESSATFHESGTVTSGGGWRGGTKLLCRLPTKVRGGCDCHARPRDRCRLAALADSLLSQRGLGDGAELRVGRQARVARDAAEARPPSPR